MKVSVIIPFYSNIRWLEEAIESVLNQTFTDYEIIIVNDGSPENDNDFRSKYENHVKVNYFKTENKGPAYARNYGITKTSGEYLAFLDSDDLWLKEKLEKQVKLMDDYSLNWSHTKYSVFDEVPNKEDRIYHEINNEDFKGIVYPQCLTKLHIGTPCVMVRKSYILKNNFIRFSENMRFGQDGYFWILMGVKNELGYINENLTLVRRAGSNAVQRARVHLNVRGNLSTNLINKLDSFYPNIKVNSLTKITYRYCNIMNSTIDQLFGTKNFKKKSAEVVSKIAYMPAYIMFKNIIK
ncbi:glycosyltransferase family 2 protein [Chryseobacterium indoltheticum]|uniref:Glycosyltransferase family 2 protein n=1 Tax=Chryseobacterium indoltheticum TaxID=254 RepID=A0A3G6N9X7_9FLAO|nr:glycosyltransferase family 2 protein [Chryseobacterium indoltheticum]AZA62755.1 glycosyltransferase family 2 protein [Chryseobacterium indoltheticum]